MDRPIIVYAIVQLLGITLSSISQVMLKKSALRSYPSPFREYFNTLVISAYGIFFVTTFFSIYAFKAIPLTMGAILTSVSYLYTTVWGAVFFHEKITGRKMAALVLILSGIAVYSIWG